MRTSEATDALMKALAESQAKFPKISKGKTAKVKMKSGGEYSYSYADLGDVLEAVRPVLTTHKLAVVQAIDVDDDTGRMLLRTRIGHESGQWVESCYPLPSEGTAQEMGSALTYARRYSLCALAGVTGEDDDDGQQAGTVRAQARPAPVVRYPAIPNAGAEEPAPTPQELPISDGFVCDVTGPNGERCVRSTTHSKGHAWAGAA
jgi:hypothetical protein